MYFVVVVARNYTVLHRTTYVFMYMITYIKTLYSIRLCSVSLYFLLRPHYRIRLDKIISNLAFNCFFLYLP